MDAARNTDYFLNNPVLKVKDEVEASPFDDGGEQNAYLIRLNNRHWKVSEVIYRILCSIDGARTLTEIRDYLNSSFALRIEEQKLEQIIELALVRNGILEGTTTETAPPRNRMMWGKFTLIKPGAIEKLQGLSFLFRRKVLLALGSAALIWLIFIMTAYSSRTVINGMFSLGFGDLVMCYLFLVLSGFVHEFGHSIAAMASGVKPGRIGAGVYYIMPVMFSDVTRIWGIKRAGRVIVDLGGMYLQSVFLGLCYLLNIWLIDSQVLNLAILLSGFTVLGNLNPFIKFDGYWMLVDYLGVTEVKSLIVQLWSNLLGKLFRRPRRPFTLSLSKKAVLYSYSILTAGFMVYFIRFLAGSLIVAVRNLASDLAKLYRLPPSGYHFTMSGLLDYASSRITTLLALFFFGNLIWRYGIRQLVHLLSKSGKPAREEARYGAD